MSTTPLGTRCELIADELRYCNIEEITLCVNPFRPLPIFDETFIDKYATLDAWQSLGKDERMVHVEVIVLGVFWASVCIVKYPNPSFPERITIVDPIFLRPWFETKNLRRHMLKVGGVYRCIRQLMGGCYWLKGFIPKMSP